MDKLAFAHVDARTTHSCRRQDHRVFRVSVGHSEVITTAYTINDIPRLTETLEGTNSSTNHTFIHKPQPPRAQPDSTQSHKNRTPLHTNSTVYAQSSLSTTTQDWLCIAAARCRKHRKCGFPDNNAHNQHQHTFNTQTIFVYL